MDDAGLENELEAGVAVVDHAPVETDPETDAEFSVTEEVDLLDTKEDDCPAMLPPLVIPIVEVEKDGGDEAFEACDTEAGVLLAEVDPLAPAPPWQLTGIETGVASTAVIGVVVLMVKERPWNAE